MAGADTKVRIEYHDAWRPSSSLFREKVASPGLGGFPTDVLLLTQGDELD